MGTERLPIAKASRYNVALPAAESNILSTGLTPTSEPSYFWVHVALAIAGILRVVRTVGATSITKNLNAGAALVADALYSFPIAVNEDETINFRYSTSGGAQTLTNNTGVATGSPISLAAGSNTIVVSGAGTFDIALPAGVTGVAASGTATLVGSPVTLPAGVTTTVDTGVTTGNFTVTLTGTLKTLIVDEVGVS